MIESFVEGRVRLRSPLLGDTSVADFMRSELLSIEGVNRVTVNPKTSGLLLEYSPSALPISLLMRAVPLFQQVEGLESVPPCDRVGFLKELMGSLKSLLSEK